MLQTSKQENFKNNDKLTESMKLQITWNNSSYCMPWNTVWSCNDVKHFVIHAGNLVCFSFVNYPSNSSLSVAKLADAGMISSSVVYVF
jgi:hypothetical protein